MSPFVARRVPERVRSVALAARLAVLVGAVEPDRTPSRDVGGLRRRVQRLLAEEGDDGAWLTLAVLHAQIPTVDAVIATRRAVELDGPAAALVTIEADAPAAGLADDVVVSDATLVDVHQLARSPFSTGIQRVTQETVRRWHRDHPITPVVWTGDLRAPREPDETELVRALGPAAAGTAASGRVVVPWRARYLLPELALDPARTARIQSIGRHSRSATAAIVFDMVPLTFAETADTGVPSDFAHQLAALRHLDRLVAISEATRLEYEGWRTMISAAGHRGPQVGAVPLPEQASVPSAADLEAARRRFTLPDVPLVLCVGSHEPRKNHTGVLHAAELLWRQGYEFSLLFVGGNSWGGGRFRRRLAELLAAGRDVESVTRVDEAQLWALYRLARCTVFPSLSEGFGLPVAESLASGTPVVTSSFGSMAEIGAGGGALLVDPRHSAELAGALGALLTDDALHARLSAQAIARPVRGWDDYAAEVWAAFS